MKLHPLFKVRRKPTAHLIELLEGAVLGTNGAKYRHMDVSEKIKQLDDPLYLSLERTPEKAIGNITCCRRKEAWYIRYFAFNKSFQSAGKKKGQAREDSLLRSELSGFFDQALDPKGEYKAKSFYAYIDPNNEKSLWMSENFDFKVKAKIATQSFSRTKPKNSKRVVRTENWDELKEEVLQIFSCYNYFFEEQVSKAPYYIIRDETGEIIAGCKISKALWEIQRLPGRFGGVLTKIIPFVPVLRKIIIPKAHTFVVPEAVIVKDNNIDLLNELFEAILHTEKENLILWWTDVKDPLYQSSAQRMKWGPLHLFVGVNYANLVVKEANGVSHFNENMPTYTSGIDFI